VDRRLGRRLDTTRVDLAYQPREVLIEIEVVLGKETGPIVGTVQRLFSVHAALLSE
jgi:hypothetical protein